MPRPPTSTSPRSSPTASRRLPRHLPPRPRSPRSPPGSPRRRPSPRASVALPPSAVHWSPGAGSEQVTRKGPVRCSTTLLCLSSRRLFRVPPLRQRLKRARHRSRVPPPQRQRSRSVPRQLERKMRRRYSLYRSPRTSPEAVAGDLPLVWGSNTKTPTLVRMNMSSKWIRPWPSNGERETIFSPGRGWNCHGQLARRIDGISKSIWASVVNVRKVILTTATSTASTREMMSSRARVRSGMPWTRSGVIISAVGFQ